MIMTMNNKWLQIIIIVQENHKKNKTNKTKQKQNNIYTYIYENNLLASFHLTAVRDKETVKEQREKTKSFKVL